MIDAYSLWFYSGIAVGMVVYAIRSHRLGLGLRFPIFHAVLLVIGLVAGGRAAFILQYRNELPAEIWNNAASLIDPRSGIVAYGGIVSATLLHLLYCWFRSRRAAVIADLITPSLLLAVAFGRLGCHFRGCCFGALTQSVFSIPYCNGSKPFAHFAASGIVDPKVHKCITVYPTQLLYVAIALIAAIMTTTAFRVRPRNFSMAALALCIMSLGAIAIHQLRADASGLTVAVNSIFVAFFLPFVIFSYTCPIRSPADFDQSWDLRQKQRRPPD